MYIINFMMLLPNFKFYYLSSFKLHTHCAMFGRVGFRLHHCLAKIVDCITCSLLPLFLYIFVMFLFSRKLGERERHTDQKLEEKSKRQRRLGNQIDFYFCQNVLMAQKGRTDKLRDGQYRGRTIIWLVALLWHLHYVSFATQNRTFLTDRWTWTWSQKANQLISQNMRNQYRQFIAW